jgi:phosphoribosylanthranilate isomerase
MRRIRVKICGITSLKDLAVAVDAGADAIGVVIEVPESPRSVSAEMARKIIDATPIFVETVGVVVPSDLAHLEKVFRACQPSSLQVHGLTTPFQILRELLGQVKLIAPLQVRAEMDMTALDGLAEGSDAILLDSYVRGKHGGSGLTHDWVMSKQIRMQLNPKPLILAGGLSPGNVQEAIRIVQPYAVDVSTGVESSPGTKDPKKVREFIRHAKAVEL